jgi:hypothetical protein
MSKAAAVVFADTESHGDLARAVNALETVKEFQEAGDDVVLIFDGAGTRWIGEFAKTENRSHRLYQAVKGSIAGACSLCAAAFGAKAAIEAEGIQLLDEFERHPSLRRLVKSGYEVITF